MKNFDYQKQGTDFLKKHGVTMETKLLGNFPYFDDEKESRDVYQITFFRNNKRWSFRFGQSIANSMTEKRKAPTAYDVLAAITKNDPGTFEDFCRDFGYDEDSRKVEKVYFAVQKEFTAVEKMFGDCIEELQEIN